MSARPRPRYIECAERIELCGHEASPKILSSLPHGRGYRSATFHHRKGVNCPVRPGRPTRIIANRALQTLDETMVEALRCGQRVGVCRAFGTGATRIWASHSEYRTYSEHFGQDSPLTTCSSRFRNCREGPAACRARRPPTALASVSTSCNRLSSAILPETI